jgi:uncharacterized protein YraI
MNRIWRIGIGAWLVVLVLAGCNLSRSKDRDEVRPTLGTPIAWATARTETATSPAPAVTVPTVTAAPTLTPLPAAQATLTAIPLPSPTPAPTLTRTPFEIVTFGPTLTAAPTSLGITTLTPAPTLTLTPFQLSTFTPAPVLTESSLGIITLTPVPTQINLPAMTYVPPATFTPVMYPTTPYPTAPPSAQVCATCSQLRLRSSPGTAGDVVTMLNAGMPLSIIGRTADNAWVQVVLDDGRNGWVAAQYLDITIDLNVVSVTGSAQDAPTAVASLGTIDVVSGVSSHSRLIFLDGRARGNLAHVFTRVGDSITASPNFLTVFGSGNYSLGQYGYLGGAISFFSGPNARGANPFLAASLAARNGWSTESVLNPANADPNVCRPGETPLACEYRLVRPSVALIMLGTNDSGGMPIETFRANLQAIVQTSITMGVIPVLSTIPSKHYNPATDQRAMDFNQVIIATAQAYDVPLWNYWKALSVLPGEGLASDGVHPSSAWDGLNAIFDTEHLRYGFPVRNLTALQVLYTLWQQVLYDGDQAPAATLPPSSGQPGGTQPGGPSEISCQGAPPPNLTVGGQGRVTPGLPNKVRSQPGMAAAQIGNVPGEGVFSVIGGPVCADGYLWWQISYNGLTGWTADGSGSEYWVEPYP